MTSLIVNEGLWRSLMAPEGLLVSWRSHSGELVRMGQALCELLIEGKRHVFTAPRSGRLQRYADDGALIEPGALIGAIDVPDTWRPKIGGAAGEGALMQIKA